ncbi:MAG: AAA family ATPase [Peptococcaceae bacterium]|jgi:superfamily I DNA/RNA helicase|nr:AAA family ATPase [Peptococcaceae bacterium]
MLGITPQGKQREVMALPAQGHIIVLGAAGSGKTTIALLRAYQLANRPGSDKVLLVTFNGALVEYMKGISDQSAAKLQIESYHKFARGYLSSRGKTLSNVILNTNGKNHFIEQAVDSLKRQNPAEPTLKRPKEFFIEEITFIEKFGFADIASYYGAERIGRGAANIKRENRKWIFAAYEKYVELREAAGRKYDWDDLALHAYNELQDDATTRRYTHIIVDEGQDFSPMMIKSLISAVKGGGSFTFFGDVAQQIYGSRLSWRDSGINAEKVWRLDANYRNPTTIVEFAKDITRSLYWRNDNDMVEATMQIAEGPKPVLIGFSCRQREMEWVVETAIKNARVSSTVIICRKRADISLFMPLLNNKGCLATEIDRKTPGYAHVKTVYLSTFHATKGLEFDNVLVPFLSSDKFPDPDTVANAMSEDEAYSDEIKLLYVAVTRSKYALYMTYSDRLSPLFPRDSDNYDFSEEEDI